MKQSVAKMALVGLTSIFQNIAIVFVFLCVVYISTVSAYKAEYVTCGTILKLMNSELSLRLHSHDVKYGTGSGQQSVTGTEVQEDVNSHWLVRAASGASCKRGDPIKCGTTFRLQHVTTSKNLHSHHFSSPLSGHQEISCYGDERGEGDSGDHWIVVCNNDYWRRDSPVKLQHVDTQAFLAGSGRTFGRPINGQGEIVGVSSQYAAYTDWISKEGIFVHPSDVFANSATHARHTEL